MKEVETKARIEPMTVTIPPFSENAGRIVGAIAGLTIVVLGVLMMITLILFIPGMFGVLIGLVLAVLCTPKASVNCPVCSTENKVALKSKQLKCEGCSTPTPLRWQK